ncbi:PH and SEC7 domain-containing protein 1-like isoform X2 [Hemicordylus capensis]|uniref:PH and SEC7 domain-containing protein 1-like isoform X2 n=1 Tax=Hemicordylus capensis TaxID=884348 RepID=UPI0023031131|nr:PH and SEC7 domain-containing protein 1-like isoform X2 [Hemicordylus capensis]XP_053125340.1 PH and SEC7 domain-containing protein 1-like isoform X2 [Hemicordylus capensis]XP_053125341.1 PH and SEC7 domain-containing protein 1-like isoform X2 [Hemicordylus capensis]
MEHSGPASRSDLMDFLAEDTRGELSCGAGAGLGGPPDPPAPSALPRTAPGPCPPLLLLQGTHFLPASWEGAGSSPELSSEKSCSDLARRRAEPSRPEAGPRPSESRGFFSEKHAQPPRRGAFQPESQNRPAKSSDDAATQALFWNSLLQAQRCVLDLQGEIDRQKEPPELPCFHPEEKAPPSPGMALSLEPLLLDSGSEKSSERQDEDEGSSEEEEEEEEEEYLFYNNPLFQESPGPLTRTIGFAGPTMWSHPEREASPEKEESPLLSRDWDADVCCQSSVASSPLARDSFSAFELEARADLPPSPVPAYLPHCRPLSPLVITEGDLESTFPAAESTQAPSCFPVLLTHGPSGSLLDSTTAGPTLGGTDLPGGGLLFSASSTCLVSALLHDDHDDDGPPSPGELSWPPSSSQVFSAPPSLWPENAPHASPSPSCTWVEAPERTSCLEEEAAAAAAAAARDLLSASLGAVARELECSAEGLEMVQVPPLQGQEAEEAEEEEAAPAPPRPEELPPGPSETGEPLNPKEQQPEPNGLLANGTSGDQAAARRLAARLYRLDGFKRSQVASFLRKNNEFSRQVAEAFLSFFQFSGKTLDQALRLFLKAFVLTGETQERERILRHFSQRYHACNPEAFLGPDAVHTLTCAIMLLNTDLHGQHAGRSMTCQEFLTNLEGLNSGQNFSKEQLKVLYSSIRQEKLEWAVDEDEAPGPATPQPAAPSRKKNNPFLTLQHHPGAETYRQGLLARKVHAEADGKKTPWGKRGWKVFHTVLKGMVLCFCKDEGQPDGAEEPLGVHHALAEKASKYTKRPNVFRLQTADWRIFLFQAPTPEEMHSWISRINLAAAMFSSPPFPAAVGSQRKFIRPILPTAPCRSSLEDQHQAHEDWMDKMSDDLLEHQRNLPDKRGRGRDLEEYQLKKEYLLYEKRRYETYVRLLEVKLSSATEDLDQWEARLREAESAEEESAGLKKSHSSPSLNVDGLPAGGVGVKVKRNISERRTVRRVIPRRHKHLL